MGVSEVAVPFGSRGWGRTKDSELAREPRLVDREAPRIDAVKLSKIEYYLRDNKTTLILSVLRHEINVKKGELVTSQVAGMGLADCPQASPDYFLVRTLVVTDEDAVAPRVLWTSKGSKRPHLLTKNARRAGHPLLACRGKHGPSPTATSAGEHGT